MNLRTLLATMLLAGVAVTSSPEAGGASVPFNGLVSRSTTDIVGDASSSSADLSGDGRVVVFDSLANNLVPDVATPHRQVFVRDVGLGTTSLVSRSPEGLPANGQSTSASVSGDGRFVAFESRATNLVELVEEDNNRADDIFIHDTLTGQTEVVLSPAATVGNGPSFNPSISADGRFVAFESDGSNLIFDEQTGGDENETRDVFVYDRTTRQSRRVSVSSEGVAGNGPSSDPEISADGRFVVFESRASNLVPNDTNAFSDHTDVFLHDLQLGRTVRVSVDADGRQASGSSEFPHLSADGRFVVFGSSASDLVDDDINDLYDVFRKDTVTGDIIRVNVSTEGVEADDGNSEDPSITADGRYVAFASEADNLVPDDRNKQFDVFVHDVETGTTTRLSVDQDGRQAIGHSFLPTIDAAGRVISFESEAPTLSSLDNNRVSDVFLADVPPPPADPGPSDPGRNPADPTCGGFAATVVIAEGDVPTPGDDVIVGTPGPDVIEALGGDDVICGLGGADRIRGQGGNDVIYGQGGRDRLFGGSGNDELRGGSARDRLVGGAGNDELFGGGGNDRLLGRRGNDTMVGGRGTDRCVGGAGTDIERSC